MISFLAWLYFKCIILGGPVIVAAVPLGGCLLLYDRIRFSRR